MADINPTTQAVEPPVQGAGATDTTLNQAATGVSADLPVEQWDKARAADTIKAQREEAKQLKAQLKELEALKAEKRAKEDAELTELQRLQKQAAELQAERNRLALDLLRRDVVNETGLPAAFADRIKGDTKDAMLADAQEILKLLPQQPQTQTKTPPNVPATNPNGANLTESEAQMRQRLFGKTGSIFDVEEAKRNGGGVIFRS